MVNNGIEIVIVEDNPSDAELLMRVFKKHNVANNIVLLKDGAEAMDYFFPQNALARSGTASKIIILDLKLPKINGIEVLRRLKAEETTKNLPVVVLTSSREERDLRDSYNSGVNSYVTKPIKFDEFAKVVSELEMYWLLINKPPVLE
jgi:CheY-like chemotaxis protein